MDDLINEISNSQVNLYVDGYKEFFKFEVSGSANAISDVNNDFKLYLKLFYVVPLYICVGKHI